MKERNSSKVLHGCWLKEFLKDSHFIKSCVLESQGLYLYSTALWWVHDMKSIHQLTTLLLSFIISFICCLSLFLFLIDMLDGFHLAAHRSFSKVIPIQRLEIHMKKGNPVDNFSYDCLSVTRICPRIPTFQDYCLCLILFSLWNLIHPQAFIINCGSIIWREHVSIGSGITFRS